MLPPAMMPPGAPPMMPPAGPAGPPLGAPPMAPGLPGGAGGHDFSMGILAGLGMREFSQLFGLSKNGKQSGQTAQPSAAALMQGNMGDMDRQMVLAEMLKRQQAAASPLPGAGLPSGAGMPPPGGFPPRPMMPPGAPPMGGPPPVDPRMAAALLAARQGAPAPAPAPAPQGGGPMATALLSQLMAKAMQARSGPI